MCRDTRPGGTIEEVESEKKTTEGEQCGKAWPLYILARRRHHDRTLMQTETIPLASN